MMPFLIGNHPRTEFKKGDPPHKHRQGCRCFRCSGVAWNKGKHIQTNTGKTHFKKGSVPFFKGKHLPEGVKKKLSISLIKLGRKGTKHWNWQGGLTYIHYPLIWNYLLKKEVRNRDKNICRICGMKNEEHQILTGRELFVHHINYNKKDCDMDNLISLCSFCHGKTNYKREQWIKFFEKKGVA